MTFTIDTAQNHVDVTATTAWVDETQTIRVRDYRRATSLFNKIRENVESIELVEQLDDYWQRESLTLDALYLFDPTVSAELTEVYETHRSCLVHGGAARPALPGNSAQTAHDGNNGNDQGEYW